MKGSATRTDPSAEFHEQTVKMNDQTIQSQEMNSQIERVQVYFKFRESFSTLLTAAEAREYVPALKAFVKEEHFKKPGV